MSQNGMWISKKQINQINKMRSKLGGTITAYNKLKKRLDQLMEENKKLEAIFKSLMDLDK